MVNRNTVPFSSKYSARVTGGMRLGTPAVTARGFGADEMKSIAAMIINVISHIDDVRVHQQVKEEVAQICSRFPVPGIDD